MPSVMTDRFPKIFLRTHESADRRLVAGTLFGAVLGNIMPEIITTSLGIALYGMFIAVVVPKARENRHVLITVILAIIFSTVIRYVPVFSGISAGFAIIISAVIASVAGAVLFPVKEAE